MAKIFIGNVKGVGISAIYKQYYASTSSSNPIGGEWVDIAPTIEEGQYLWSRWKTELTNGAVEVTEAVQEGIAGSDITALESIVSDLETDVDGLENLLNTIAPSNIVDIAHGGTSASTAAEARQNINYMGGNPISSIDDDTPANWSALGTGIAGYNTTGLITDQPSQYGILVNQVYGNSVFQKWCGTNVNNIWFRRGNENGWQTSWTKLLNENNGIQFVKLWENASPTSNFVAQTINLNLSEYDAVLINFITYANSNYNDKITDSILTKIGIGGYAKGLGGKDGYFSGQAWHGARTFTVNASGVTFDGGYSVSGTGAWVSSTPACIPYEIYGVKGVQ